MSEDLLGRFEVCRIPLRQLMTIDGLDAVTPGHRTYGLVEFDVTTANTAIAGLRRQGHRLSLTSHVISCIGWALAQNPALNSVRAGRSVYRFEDVDVNLSLELQTPRGRFPHQLTIRRAQDKSAETVFAEIDAARERYTRGRGAGVEDRRLERAVGWLARLPRPVRLSVLRVAAGSPRRVKRWSGTTFVTSVTKFVESGGFIIPFAAGPTAVSFALGGVGQRQVCENGVHQTHDYLSVTVIVNHDLVDGGPAARFVRQLQTRVEAGGGLLDED